MSLTNVGFDTESLEAVAVLHGLNEARLALEGFWATFEAQWEQVSEEEKQRLFDRLIEESE